MRECFIRRLAVLALLCAPVFVYAQEDPDPTKSKPAPSSMGAYRGQTGKVLRVVVTGNNQAGTVWGTDIYTDDSAISAAVVHAGLLKHGETGVVKIVVVEGQGSYTGQARNGVQSNNYNAWGGSYKFEGKAQIRVAKPMSPDNPMADPGYLTAYRGQHGKVLYIEVVGKKGGSVYGTGIYTDDSTIASAAIHQGILKEGEKKVLKVTILEGQNSYKGSTQNDITSSEYGSWSGSYKMEVVEKKK